MVAGSPPCSYRQAGVWRGLAVDLWNRVASLESLPYVVSEWPSVRQLLEASRVGRLDVAVGCINVSPDRLQRYRFSLPFQEDGLAVMVVKSRLDLGRSFLAALLTPTLLQLLGGYLLAIAGLTWLTLRLEAHTHPAQASRQSSLRHCSKVFQVLATGPGSNTIVTTIRGNGIVILAYLVRIVSASLLVGYLTVNVAGEIQGRSTGAIRSPADLRGLRVGVRSGTVSESLLKELNASSPGNRATIVPLASIRAGGDLLAERRIDALLGDNLQLSHLLLQEETKGFLPSLALEGIRPESQAFAFSPTLPEATADRIDQAISALKRSGVVSELRQQATTRGNPQAR
ncbi:transporter substrate-binding domain-containing protein [Cyanobium gracile UHCC 0139]|uniref:Transporter substrate-binding domain-containing protein n=1 Tax=Cyanobium gracile UHCC 0139 TaxID=3110308 RepID=A0ABU5RU62_9CYAN|nr:transporter substrate-binding domain-containing protein [Cyanobium gracile]MEA5391271.1 transporter substrate-binding domain-containing protein [Cyanobium gracile UHCC 0139]